MDCEKCGAQVPAGAKKCPECGEKLASSTDSHPAALTPLNVAAKGSRRKQVPVPEILTGKQSVDAPKVVVNVNVARDGATDGAVTAPKARAPREPFKLPTWAVPATVAVAVIAAIALVVVYFIVPRLTTVTGPEGAAQRMMQAFGSYDAQGVLDNATHPSLTATDIVAFEKQVAEAKQVAGGKPNLKDLKILSTTVDPADKNTAVIQLSAQWLTDPVKGIYSQRTETVTVVYKDGKWQVVLFQ